MVPREHDHMAGPHRSPSNCACGNSHSPCMMPSTGRLSVAGCAKLLLKQVLLRMDLMVSGARSLFSSVPSAAANVPGVRHPYYPRDILLPGYQPLVLPYEGILTAFFGAAAVIFACTWAASGAQPTPQQTLLPFQLSLWLRTQLVIRLTGPQVWGSGCRPRTASLCAGWLCQAPPTLWWKVRKHCHCLARVAEGCADTDWMQAERGALRRRRGAAR